MSVQASIFLFQIKVRLHVNRHILFSFSFSVCFASNQELFSRAQQWQAISNALTLFPKTETEVTSPPMQQASSGKDPAKVSSGLCQSTPEVERKITICSLCWCLPLPKEPKNKQKTDQKCRVSKGCNTGRSIILSLALQTQGATNHTFDKD